MDSVNSVYMHVNMCVYTCVCITIIIKKNKPLIGGDMERVGRKKDRENHTNKLLIYEIFKN